MENEAKNNPSEELQTVKGNHNSTPGLHPCNLHDNNNNNGDYNDDNNNN